MEDQTPPTTGFQGVQAMTTLDPARTLVDQVIPLQQNQHQMPVQQDDDSKEMTIAKRTRSRVPLNDFEPVDRLDFPDVDTSLYQSADSEGDTPYREFLRHLYEGVNESMTDPNTDDHDPDYRVNDDFFSYGWRFDVEEELEQRRADLEASFQQQDQNPIVKSCDTTNLNNNNNNNDNVDTDLHHRIDLCASFSDEKLAVSSLSIAPGFKSPNKHGRCKIDIFEQSHFKRILDQQLRQHIQLLTQTFLLTKNTKVIHDEAIQARGYLEAYLKIFKNKYKPSNLLPAIELIDSVGSDVKYPYIRLSWRPLPIPDPIRTLLDTRRDIFMYQNLLPEVSFSKMFEKLVKKKEDTNVGKQTRKKNYGISSLNDDESGNTKAIFTPNEDKLLALALKQFQGETSQYACISKLLMAAKTKMQINNRIKNIKRSPGNEDHPVKKFYASGKLPEIDLDADAKLRPPRAPSEQAEDSEPENPCEDQPEIEKNERSIEHECTSQDKEEEKIIHLDTSHSENNEAVLTPSETFERGESEHQQREDSQHVARSSEIEEVQFQHFGDFSIVNQQSNVIEQHERMEEKASTPSPEPFGEDFSTHQDCEDIMNMDLDDLMAASTTISKATYSNNYAGNSVNSGNISEKSMKNQKLRSSMVELMSNHFSMTKQMGDLIVEEFISASQSKLGERNHIHLLQLLAELMRKESMKSDSGITIYKEISKFLVKIEAPNEFQERLVLFLDLHQATKVGCATSYLHWMRFFEFLHHAQLHHEGEAIEKKLSRLIDALQKDDPHKVKLAAANLINKHPLLRRDFDSLELQAKPHPSFFICDEDFDDVTEPMAMFQSRDGAEHGRDPPIPRDVYDSEHFELRPTTEETNFASPSCPCNCHHQHPADKSHDSIFAQANGVDNHTTELGQHCNKCNLKFMKGRMYLVGKIKPFLAEWAYINTPPPSEASTSSPVTVMPTNSDGQRLQSEPQPVVAQQPDKINPEPQWTFEEDKEILEFCRSKAEQNDESLSFDASTFEELVDKRRFSGDEGPCKKSATQIAERFNQLMDMYRVGGP